MITEVAIQKMIEASQKMINEQLNSPPVNEHFKLQIKTLQNAPRDADDKLERLLRLKEMEKEAEAMHIEDTQRLVTEEIEMLKVVLHLVAKNRRNKIIHACRVSLCCSFIYPILKLSAICYNRILLSLCKLRP
jgi:hypothetical protein